MTNLSSIRHRVSEYLLIKGISKYKFYQETGLSNGFLDKQGAMTSDNCEKICYVYPDMEPEWLLTGKGEMLRNLDQIDNQEISSTETLVRKILELSAENTKLKSENESLRKRIVIHKPIGEDDMYDNIAAQPIE